MRQHDTIYQTPLLNTFPYFPKKEKELEEFYTDFAWDCPDEEV